MKILLATGIYPPESGGPATYTQACAQALVERGHEVVVVTYGEESHNTYHATRITEEIEANRFEVTRVSRRGGPMLRYLRYAWNVYKIARQGVDLIYAQGAVSEGVPSTLAARLLGKKVVMRIPGDYAWEMGMQVAPEATESSLDRFLSKSHRGVVGLYECLERWTTRSAWSVIVPGQYIRSVAERWGVPTERIQVIKNAVQSLPSGQERIKARKHFNIVDKTVCLTVVRAVPWKGVNDLINWWHRLPSTHVLVVAGDGPELPKWKELAAREGLQERIRFLGRVEREVLADWYDAADVFILHTGYEGYPHTVPEAVSRGLTCFVSDQAGNPETQEEFGDKIKILPYQNRDAWIEALREIAPRSAAVPAISSWTHAQMVDAVEQNLASATRLEDEGPTKTVMVSYERELLKTESQAFARVAAYSTESLTLSALVLGRFPQGVSLERDGLRVHAFQGWSGRRIWQAIRVGVKEAKRLPGRTLISAQDPFVAGFVGYCISRWTNQPLEIQEHADFYSGQWIKERWPHRLLSWLGICLSRRAESVRVVSERVKEHLMTHKVAAEKIHVMPVAQDLKDLLARPLASHIDGPFTFVAPCRFVPQKGLDILLDAFGKLRAQSLPIRLRIVGAGPLEAWLREQVEVRGWSDIVELKSWMPKEELWDDVHAFVLSSRYEGWGRTIVEAMAAGVPVVTTRVGCVGSFFRDGVDGFVAQINDSASLAEAMKNCFTNKEEREKRQIAARERAKSFPLHNDLQAQQRTSWRSTLVDVSTRQVGSRFELWVLGFVVFALLSRAASVILFHGQLVYREWGFYTLVDRWFQGFGYSYAAQLGCASAYRSPGYLFFLTGLYSFFDPTNTWAQAIIQNIFVVGALWLTYVVGKRLVGQRAALIGAFIMACYPYTFYHYTQYYHTFLQAFFLLLVVWCLLRLDEKRRYRDAIFSGLAIGCLAYVQGTILAATPLIALWILWRLWPDWKRAGLAIMLVAVCSAGLIAPWTYRNWRVFHHFVPLTTDVGFALFKANNENIGALTARGYPQEVVGEVFVSSTNPNHVQYRLPQDLETQLMQEGALRPSVFWTQWHPREPAGRAEHCEDLGPLNEYETNRYWVGQATTWIKDHWTTEGWRLQLQKLSTFWRPGLFPTIKMGAPWSFAGTAWKEYLARTAVALSMLLVVVGGWSGMLLALYRRRASAWLPLVIILVYTGLHTFIAGYTKYRIPLDHLLAVYAGFALVAAWDKWPGKKSL